PQTLITTAPASGRAHGIGVASGPRPAVATRAATLPAAGPQPHAAAGEDETPVVSERTPNGLPQRRRRHAAPAGRAQTLPTGSAESPRIPEPAAAPVQPGMWLAAFQSGVNGETPATAPAGHNSDESSGKGEQ
ncbi:hypothetical protein P3T39_007473, partial [Kitasatospora sp. GP82]|nr:hypothetical protein [Kitasatospora sp. GP82]